MPIVIERAATAGSQNVSSSSGSRKKHDSGVGNANDPGAKSSSFYKSGQELAAEMADILDFKVYRVSKPHFVDGTTTVSLIGGDLFYEKDLTAAQTKLIANKPADDSEKKAGHASKGPTLLQKLRAYKYTTVKDNKDSGKEFWKRIQADNRRVKNMKAGQNLTTQLYIPTPDQIFQWAINFVINNEATLIPLVIELDESIKTFEATMISDGKTGKTSSDNGKTGRMRSNLTERLRSSSPSTTPNDPNSTTGGVGNSGGSGTTVDHITGKIYPLKTISLAQQLEQMKTAGVDSFLRSITLRNTILHHPPPPHQSQQHQQTSFKYLPENQNRNRNMTTSAASIQTASSHTSSIQQQPQLQPPSVVQQQQPPSPLVGSNISSMEGMKSPHSSNNNNNNNKLQRSIIAPTNAPSSASTPSSSTAAPGRAHRTIVPRTTTTTIATTITTDTPIPAHTTPRQHPPQPPVPAAVAPPHPSMDATTTTTSSSSSSRGSSPRHVIGGGGGTGGAHHPMPMMIETTSSSSSSKTASLTTNYYDTSPSHTSKAMPVTTSSVPTTPRASSSSPSKPQPSQPQPPQPQPPTQAKSTNPRTPHHHHHHHQPHNHTTKSFPKTPTKKSSETAPATTTTTGGAVTTGATAGGPIKYSNMKSMHGEKPGADLTTEETIQIMRDQQKAFLKSMGYTLSLFRQANEKQHQLQNANHSHITQAHKDGHHLYTHCLDSFHAYEQVSRVFVQEMTDEKDFHRYEQMEMKIRLVNGGTACGRTGTVTGTGGDTITSSSAGNTGMTTATAETSTRGIIPTTVTGTTLSVYSPRPPSPTTTTTTTSTTTNTSNTHHPHHHLLPKPPMGTIHDFAGATGSMVSDFHALRTLTKEYVLYEQLSRMYTTKWYLHILTKTRDYMKRMNNTLPTCLLKYLLIFQCILHMNYQITPEMFYAILLQEQIVSKEDYRKIIVQQIHEMIREGLHIPPDQYMHFLEVHDLAIPSELLNLVRNTNTTNTNNSNMNTNTSSNKNALLVGDSAAAAVKGGMMTQSDGIVVTAEDGVGGGVGTQVHVHSVVRIMSQEEFIPHVDDVPIFTMNPPIFFPPVPTINYQYENENENGKKIEIGVMGNAAGEILPTIL